MSWEDKFNTYLHKTTENTTIGLISDKQAERITASYGVMLIPELN
jgi:ribosomal protein S11